MGNSQRDRWAEWILNRRHGGDPEERRAHVEFLTPVRDRVLRNAAIHDGDTVLDVCQSLAMETGVEGCCEFVVAPADDLAGISDASIDVVTTRSVLIYVDDKKRAFEEFHRVLKPGGRFSIFEPINAYFPSSPSFFWNYDVTPVSHLAAKLRAVYERAHPLDSSPMMNFGERDLLEFARLAGFEEVQLDLHVEMVPGVWWGSWKAFVNAAGNPLAPTLAEAMAEVLTEQEAAEFEAYLRPLVDAQQGIKREAVVYMRGRKRGRGREGE